MKSIAVITSRYGSTRLPAKALADIHGKPMVWWVYQRVKDAQNIDQVFVATDHKKIVEVCDKYNIPVVMTSDTHRTAANRLAEVSDKISADFYVQVNGDEPLINPELISLVIPNNIPQNYEYGTNIITKMQNPAITIDSSNIKVVFDDNLRALYMSRTPIPYPYKSISFDYYKHVGIIGYNKKMLDFYAHSEPGRFEIIEGIDTLRFIDYGKTLQFIKAEQVNSLSVDTPKDLAKIREIISKKMQNNEFNNKFLANLKEE